MSAVTVENLAKIIGSDGQTLLSQMKEAGLSHTDIKDEVTDKDKKTLLEFLKEQQNKRKEQLKAAIKEKQPQKKKQFKTTKDSSVVEKVDVKEQLSSAVSAYKKKEQNFVADSQHQFETPKEFIKKDITNEDFVICEIGGTVGDIESLPFVEAIRQFSNEYGKSKTLFIHLTFVPFLKSSDEIKTKPTQHSVKELRSIGVQPDIIICRSQQSIPLDQRKKISLFCNVPIENVIETVDVRTIYEAPISFYNQKLDKQVLKFFKLKPKKRANLNPWKKITKIVLSTKKSVNIAIIGKYVNLKDAYKSLDEALVHGGIANNVKVNLIRIESDNLKNSEIKTKLKNVSGLLIPGGFGKRGTEGKISAIKYAREKKIPFLGICFGMQMAIVEFARNKLKIKNAGSSELDKKCYPVIGLINEWDKNGKIIKGTDKNLGGTMRLGLYEAKLRNNSAINRIYKSSSIKERHRHRYEVNNKLKNQFENKGLIFSGMSPDNKLPEIIELKNHPWFIGVQFHPEFKSRPLAPHPLFSSFIQASKNHK